MLIYIALIKSVELDVISLQSFAVFVFDRWSWADIDGTGFYWMRRCTHLNLTFFFQKKDIKVTHNLSYNYQNILVYDI
jgi:hypothetical protein